jgi:hypothetical protein
MRGVLLIAIVLLTACAAKKQSAEFAAQPAWMKQKPIIPGYYIGIGSTKKVGASSEYIANARKDALADLAGEVSAQVSSTSVYHTIENKYGHIESFDQRIETTVGDYLEGFEPIEFYETDDSYWVYFRIDKTTYVEKKEMKKQEAIAVALAKYNSGLMEENGGKPKEALAFYLQGLQSIKPYLKEETSVTLNDIKIDIGNRLFSSMDLLLSALSISAETSEVEVKRGISSDQRLTFKVLYKSQPAQGIPVGFSYTGGYLKNDRNTTDGNGIAILQLEVIYSKNKHEQLTAQINLKEIASKAVEDTFIRGLILKKSLQPATVTIDIESPTLLLEIAENCCGGDECSRLIQVFNQIATSSGFRFVNSEPFDFAFQLTYNIIPGSSAGGLVSAELKGKISIVDKDNKTIWTKEINGIRGVGSTDAQAREKAFVEFSNSLNRNYIRQGLDNIIPAY